MNIHYEAKVVRTKNIKYIKKEKNRKLYSSKRFFIMTIILYLTYFG